jgi:hypothetical protein
VNSVAYITQLTECCTKFANCKSPCYIVGDLNCSATADWSCCTAPADNVQDSLLNFAVKYSFVQMITDRTRSSNILDIVLTNEPITLVDSKAIAPFANSDPCQVNFILAFEMSNVSVFDSPVDQTMHLRQNDDFVSIAQFVDWYQLFTVNLTANSLWTAFTTVLQQAVCLYLVINLL